MRKFKTTTTTKNSWGSTNDCVKYASVKRISLLFTYRMTIHLFYDKINIKSQFFPEKTRNRSYFNGAPANQDKFTGTQTKKDHATSAWSS